MNGEDEEFAHGVNVTTTAIPCKTARHRRIPSYYEFATDMRSILLAAGADPVGSSPQEFAAFFRAEIAKWTRIVQSVGIRSE